MQHNNFDENKIIVAVRKIAKAVKSNSKPDISELVEVTSNLRLKNLDYWERLIRWEYSDELRQFNSLKWRFWKQTENFSLTWLDICHGDGFIREKILRELSCPAPNSFFFALAIRRLNDWVVEVRRAAYETIPQIAKQTNPEIIADVLCAIFPHWNSWGRVDVKEKQLILDLASKKEVGIALKNRIQFRANGPLSSILSQIGQIDILDSHLEEISNNAIQPSVRAKAYRSLLDGYMSWCSGREWKWTNKPYGEGYYKPIIHKRNLSKNSPFLKILQLATIDRSPIVRRVAGEMLIKHLNETEGEVSNIAQLLARDASPSVAERGVFALKKLEEIN